MNRIAPPRGCHTAWGRRRPLSFRQLGSSITRAPLWKTLALLTLIPGCRAATTWSVLPLSVDPGTSAAVGRIETGRRVFGTGGQVQRNQVRLRDDVEYASRRIKVTSGGIEYTLDGDVDGYFVTRLPPGVYTLESVQWAEPMGLISGGGLDSGNSWNVERRMSFTVGAAQWHNLGTLVIVEGRDSESVFGGTRVTEYGWVVPFEDYEEVSTAMGLSAGQAVPTSIQ